MADWKEALAVVGRTGSDVKVVESHLGRNLVWWLDRGQNRGLFVKVEPEGDSSSDLQREIDLLGRLRGFPSLPELVASGHLSDDRVFLITHPLQGEPLADLIGRRPALPRSLLVDLATWLWTLASHDGARRYLEHEGVSYVGTWAPDYFPQASIPEESHQAGQSLGGFDAWPIPNSLTPLLRSAVIHGSFEPRNLLVLESERLQLSGVLDLEAARIGSPLLDIANLALHLLIAGARETARDWLLAAGQTWKLEAEMPQLAFPFVVSQNLLRVAAAKTDPEVEVASAEDLRNLAPGTLGRGDS